jgi:hypothetical protein
MSKKNEKDLLKEGSDLLKKGSASELQDLAGRIHTRLEQVDCRLSELKGLGGHQAPLPESAEEIDAQGKELSSLEAEAKALRGLKKKISERRRVVEAEEIISQAGVMRKDFSDSVEKAISALGEFEIALRNAEAAAERIRQGREQVKAVGRDPQKIHADRSTAEKATGLFESKWQHSREPINILKSRFLRDIGA